MLLVAGTVGEGPVADTLGRAERRLEVAPLRPGQLRRAHRALRRLFRALGPRRQSLDLPAQGGDGLLVSPLQLTGVAALGPLASEVGL